MGVVESKQFPLDAVTPVCSSCGIYLCFDIGNEEYNDNIEFWDNWECKDCNPDYRYKKIKTDK